ncbi:MAG: hypothetical protein ACYDEB_14015 [Dehalococcoidia bacterium]
MAITKTALRRSAHPAKPKAPAGSIWANIVAIGESIPPNDRARFPRDGARNLDHYLYGTPKR